jgi:hypothetical protein
MFMANATARRHASTAGSAGRARLVTTTAFYCLGSVIFFYVQLHTIVRYLDHQFPLLAVVLGLTCLKLGELVHEKVDTAGLWLWLPAVAILSPLTLVGASVLTPLIFFLFGLSMMKLRDSVLAYVPARCKIPARAAGFVLAPWFFAPVFACVLAAVTMLGICAAVQCPELRGFSVVALRRVASRENRAGYRGISLHHAHYFAYAYIVPVALVRASLPVAWVGVAFVCGWVVYNAYDKLVTPSWTLVAVGHVTVACALVGLYFGHNSVPLTLLMWFLTGLGGGVVFMMKQLLPSHPPTLKADLRISEIYGDVAGMVIWGGLLLWRPWYAFLAGAAIALVIAADTWHGRAADAAVQSS